MWVTDPTDSSVVLVLCCFENVAIISMNYSLSGFSGFRIAVVGIARSEMGIVHIAI